MPVKVEDSMFYYYYALQSYTQICAHVACQLKHNQRKNFKDCAILCNWIYGGHQKLQHATLKCEHYTLSKGPKDPIQWAICFDSHTQNAFVVFSGTNNFQDFLTDIAMPLTPIYPTQVKDTPEILAHSGIAANINLKFSELCQQLAIISNKHNGFNKLYLTGHSLGGGLAIIFGLISLIHSAVNIDYIITFGAPNVLAINKSRTQLSPDAKNYLRQLHKKTHCIVYRFDIVPRLLSSVGPKWTHFAKVEIHSVAMNFVKDIVRAIKDVFQNVACPSSNESVECRLESVIDELKKDNDYEIEQKDTVAESSWMLLNSVFNSINFEGLSKAISVYVPIGTFYFCVSQSEGYFTENYSSNQKILGYIAPERLTENAATKRNFVNDHSIERYLTLFGINDETQIIVKGYVDRIKRDIVNGKDCGSGIYWWDSLKKKECKIGIFELQQRGKDKFRIIYSMPGTSGYREIFSSNNENKCVLKFQQY